MEKSICKINFDQVTKKGTGTGFFCQIDLENFPIKYALFTNNHILNEMCIKTGKTINIEYSDESLIWVNILERRI